MSIKTAFSKENVKRQMSLSPRGKQVIMTAVGGVYGAAIIGPAAILGAVVAASAITVAAIPTATVVMAHENWVKYAPEAAPVIEVTVTENVTETETTVTEDIPLEGCLA